MTAPEHGSKDFAELASRETPGVLREFLTFLVERKKWWLGPIVGLLLILGLLIMLGGTGAAPFIYTLF